MRLKDLFAIFHFLGHIFYDLHIIQGREGNNLHGHVYGTDMDDTEIMPGIIFHSKTSLFSQYSHFTSFHYT